MSIWKAKQDIIWQDPTSPSLITKFNKITNSTTLSAEAVLDSDIITVTDPTGITLPSGNILGSYIIIFNPISRRYYFGNVIDLSGNNVTLDSQIDSVFPAGSYVDIAVTNMAVNGSIERQIFGIRGLGTIPGIVLEVDINKLIFKCYTQTNVSLRTFGDLPQLLRGVLVREIRKTGTHNICNFKTCGELAGITLDYYPFDAQNLSQGQYGFTARLSFTGADKLNTVKRLGPGEDLEIYIQDELQDLILFEVTAEGSEVR